MRLLAEPPLGTVPAPRPHATQPPRSGSSRGETRDSAGCQDAVSGPRGGASPVPRVRRGGRAETRASAGSVPGHSEIRARSNRLPRPPGSTGAGTAAPGISAQSSGRTRPGSARAGSPRPDKDFNFTPRALPQFPSPRKSAETLDVNRGAPRT